MWSLWWEGNRVGGRQNISGLLKAALGKKVGVQADEKRSSHNW